MHTYVITTADRGTISTLAADERAAVLDRLREMIAAMETSGRSARALMQAMRLNRPVAVAHAPECSACGSSSLDPADLYA